MAYSTEKYPHHGSVLIRRIIRPKTPQGFISGEMVHSKSNTFVVEANSEEECTDLVEELYKEIQETYDKWLAKKNSNVQVVERP
jgi:hypothetical protein